MFTKQQELYKYVYFIVVMLHLILFKKNFLFIDEIRFKFFYKLINRCAWLKFRRFLFIALILVPSDAWHV